MGERCTVPPQGWFCTREEGHDGPCAAWPIAPADLIDDLPRSQHAELRAENERLREAIAEHRATILHGQHRRYGVPDDDADERLWALLADAAPSTADAETRP